MNAVRDLITTVLRMVSGGVPPNWRGIVDIIANVAASVEWGDDDRRWSELVQVVTSLLNDIERASGLEGVDLTRAARAAAEIRYTRALRDAGLLPEV